MGPSGSGKSTLMNLIGCLDTPTAGNYRLNGNPVEEMDDDALARVRNREIGFVFQTFNLLARTTRSPRWSSRSSTPASRRRTAGAGGEGARAGRPDRPGAPPPERLSGGQRQHVAIARALITGASASPRETSPTRRPRLPDGRGHHAALPGAGTRPGTRSHPRHPRRRASPPHARRILIPDSHDGKISDDRPNSSSRAETIARAKRLALETPADPAAPADLGAAA